MDLEVGTRVQQRYRIERVLGDRASATRLAHDELHGERADFYQAMLKKMPAGRAGTPDEVAALAALIMGPEGGFITGSDFLIDGGATADFFYGAGARSDGK